MASSSPRDPNPLKHWEAWAVAFAVLAFIVLFGVLLHLAGIADGPSRPETLGQRIADVVLLILWP